MSNILDFQTIEELKEYAEAQFNVINQLNKDIKNLKAEKKHLEDQLKAANPVQNIPLTDNISLEEKICREQIAIFKLTSADRELTLEETRKLEIYTKILLSLRDPNQKKKSEVDKLDAKALLKLVEEPNGPKVNS